MAEKLETRSELFNLKELDDCNITNLGLSYVTLNSKNHPDDWHTGGAGVMMTFGFYNDALQQMQYEQHIFCSSLFNGTRYTRMLIGDNNWTEWIKISN